MSNPKVYIVYADGWTALYINGRLDIQGDSISISDVLNTLGYRHKVLNADLEWLHDQGEFPGRFSEVKTID